jgi:hypothetical protein
VPTVYYGPKKLLETWDWYVDRFRDRPILEVLREVRIPKKLAPFSPGGPGEVSPTIISIAKHGSYSVGDLADILIAAIAQSGNPFVVSEHKEKSR